MQDLWQGCTMLEKGASEGCYAWYAMKVDNMLYYIYTYYNLDQKIDGP